MKPGADEPKAPDSKPGSKPKPENELKSLPLPQVEKKLGSSPKRAHTARRGETAGAMGAEFLTYLGGTIPWMIEGAVILSGVVQHWLDFFHHSLSAVFQRCGGILGGTSAVKTPSDLTPHIAKRGYELYESRARKGGKTVQDWETADREIRKDEAKSQPKPEANVKLKPEANALPKPEARQPTI